MLNHRRSSLFPFFPWVGTQHLLKPPFLSFLSRPRPDDNCLPFHSSSSSSTWLRDEVMTCGTSTWETAAIVAPPLLSATQRRPSPFAAAAAAAATREAPPTPPFVAAMAGSRNRGGACGKPKAAAAAAAAESEKASALLSFLFPFSSLFHGWLWNALSSLADDIRLVGPKRTARAGGTRTELVISFLLFWT